MLTTYGCCASLGRKRNCDSWLDLRGQYSNSGVRTFRKATTITFASVSGASRPYETIPIIVWRVLKAPMTNEDKREMQDFVHTVDVLTALALAEQERSEGVPTEPAPQSLRHRYG